MSVAEEGIPEELLERRPTTFPAPEVVTAAQELPLGELEWPYFESLCAELARREGEPELTEKFGTEGQDQSGIDIYSRLDASTYATYQCRRVKELYPGGIRGAVDDFLDGEWAAKSSQFVLCTSHSTRPTGLANEIETQTKRLREGEPPVAFEAWGVEALSRKLKQHPDLVLEFFGQAWVDRFLGAAEQKSMREEIRDLRASVEELTTHPYQAARAVTLDWAPARLKRTLEKFSEDHNELFSMLTDRIGSRPRMPIVVDTIAHPPDWAGEAVVEFWTVLARIAESGGEWAAAATAWEQSAIRREGEARAEDLISAAAAAQVPGDAQRHRDLLDRAREIAPNNPRLALEEMDMDAPAAEQLKTLEKLQSDDPDTKTLVAGRAAIASLLLPDLQQAREHLQVVREHGADTVLADSVEVNVVVQEGRLQLLAGEPMNDRTLREARDRSLKARQRLLGQKRWDEAGRMLMLAADSLALLGERSEAGDLLRLATPEERSAPDGPEVLADCAASRVLDGRLALELLKGAPDSITIRRIRAEALESVGNAQERAEALKALEEIFEADGPEAPESAFIRLAATLGSRRTEWSEPAAEYLREHGHERAAVQAQAFYLARWHADYDGADELLKPHLNAGWAKVTRVRLALTRGKHSMAREAAEDLMAFGPSQTYRVEAGRAFALARDFPRAREVLLGAAQEPSAPSVVRGEAYDLLIRIVGKELGDWDMAARLHKKWTDLRPWDEKAMRWAPMVASRSTKSEG